MSYEALLKLCRISNISIPKITKILPEYWSAKKAARLGAIERNNLYGNPGTPEGRSKGGSTTVRKFREDPEFAKMLGFKLRTPMNLPGYSSELAEFIGIMLGDGYIKSNKTQAGIAFNVETDYKHAIYIQGLIRRLFDLNSSIIYDKSDKGATVLISSRNLIDFLISIGLKTGDKVVNQVDIPDWVMHKKDYKVSCLRGLMDTDGSCYPYQHKVAGKIYSNFAICFTNHSLPLLKSAYRILKTSGFSPVMSRDNRIYLHKIEEIDTYFRKISSNNPKHLSKFKKFKNNS